MASARWRRRRAGSARRREEIWSAERVVDGDPAGAVPSGSQVSTPYPRSRRDSRVHQPECTSRCDAMADTTPWWRQCDTAPPTATHVVHAKPRRMRRGSEAGSGDTRASRRCSPTVLNHRSPAVLRRVASEILRCHGVT